MAVSKSQRRLLIISELPTFGRNDLKWLYQFLDASGVAIGLSMLGPHYKEVKVLKGNNATKSKFIGALKTLCTKPGTKAVDVIIQLHGAKDKLWFRDGKVSLSRLASDIAAKKLKHRLRLLYSLACYGYSHTDDWLDAGFRTASGARKVNCNSATDYPAQLLHWAAGKSYGYCVKKGNSQPGRSIADGAAKTIGFSDADSRKQIRGKTGLKISWNAQ